MPRVETVKTVALAATVETPGTPATEKSSTELVARAFLLTMLPTMYCVLVELKDCTGWIEKKPPFAPEVTKETTEPVSISLLLSTQYWAPTKLREKKSLALTTNSSSLTPMMG